MSFKGPEQLKKEREEILDAVRDWLGIEGLAFFSKVKDDHGRLDAVWMEGGIPHPVHLREGMQIRNFLRSLPQCKDWGCHTLDNEWTKIVEEALEI